MREQTFKSNAKELLKIQTSYLTRFFSDCVANLNGIPKKYALAAVTSLKEERAPGIEHVHLIINGKRISAFFAIHPAPFYDTIVFNLSHHVLDSMTVISDMTMRINVSKKSPTDYRDAMSSIYNTAILQFGIYLQSKFGKRKAQK